MPVEIYGRIHHPVDEECKSHDGVKFDISSVHLNIRCFEDCNFDGIYLGCGTHDPDAIILASYASALTKQLKFLLGHRPAYIAPTMAARKLATLDHLTAGKLAVQMMAADDVGVGAHGGPLPFADRMERSAEYVGIVNAILSAEQPIDHAGKYYRFHAGYSDIKPVHRTGVPIQPDWEESAAESRQWPGADDKPTRQFALLLQDDVGQTDESRPAEDGEDLGRPLIGTADHIIAALMQHYDAGVRRFILAGLGATQDMARIGNEIVPTLRARVAQRDAERGIC